MRIKILVYFVMFLMVLGILRSQTGGEETDYSTFTADQIAKEIEGGYDGNLNSFNPFELQKAFSNSFEITLNGIGEGATLIDSVLKATFGAEDQLDLSDKNGWIVEIDENGNIIVSDKVDESQITEKDSFTITNAELTTSEDKVFHVEGLSVKDGGYVVNKGDTAKIGNYEITATDNDVSIKFNEDYLELLRIQTELNNELKENGWTDYANELVKERDEKKSKMEIKDAISSEQILEKIREKYSANSMIIGTDSAFANGEGFELNVIDKDGTQKTKITPKGGSIIRIEGKPPLEKIWGEVTVETGPFEVNVKNEGALLGIKTFLGGKDPNRGGEDVRIEVTEESKTPERKEEILRPDQNPSMLIGYEKAISHDTIYTFPDGTSKRGDELTDEDFRRLPVGTIISYVPDEVSLSIENNEGGTQTTLTATEAPQQPSVTATHYLGGTNTPEIPDVEDLVDRVGAAETLNGKLLNERYCYKGSCGYFQISRVGYEEGCKMLSGCDFTFEQLENREVPYEKQRELAEAILASNYRIMGPTVEGLPNDELEKRLLIGYNIGPTLTKNIAIEYYNLNGHFPNHKEFMTFLEYSNAYRNSKSKLESDYLCKAYPKSPECESI